MTGVFVHMLYSIFEHRFAPREHVPQPNRVIVVLTRGLLRADSIRRHEELGASSLYGLAAITRRGFTICPRTVIVASGKVDPRIPGRACSKGAT